MKVDKKRFIPSLLIIAVMLVVVSFNLNFIKNNVDNVYNVISHKFSWLFILANIAAFIFSLLIIFGRYSNVKLGGEKATPEYSKFSWIAMMFTTSCSAGLIVFGFIESIIYASNPPFDVVPLSKDAYELAQSYSHYH